MRPNVFKWELIDKVLDPGHRASKVSFKTLKWYFGRSYEPVASNPDTEPGRDQKAHKMRGGMSADQFEVCREASRKIFFGKVKLSDALTAVDDKKDMLLTNEQVK
jgi:hypothetical protein